MADASGRLKALSRRLGSALNTAGFVLLWGWLLLSLFFVPFYFGFRRLGVAFLIVGVVVCAGAAAASAYPVTTIGTKRRETVDPVSADGVDCDRCDRPAASGERRRIVTERVCLGAVVARPESRTVVTCPRCLEAERGVRSEDRSNGTARLETDRA